MRRYDVVFLDAQGTLLTAHPSTAAIYGGVCARLGHEVDHAEVGGTIKALWAEYRQSPPMDDRYDTSDETTRAWWADFNTRLYHRLGLNGELEQFLEEMWRVFGVPENYRLYPEVVDVLAELRSRGYRLGVVSNWDSRLIPLCERLGVTPHMEFVVASAAVGVEKPDRRIFDLALARAGVPAHRVVHVGDDYEADVLGAQGAGIDAIHLVRDGLLSQASLQIPTLQGLLDLLP